MFMLENFLGRGGTAIEDVTLGAPDTARKG